MSRVAPLLAAALSIALLAAAPARADPAPPPAAADPSIGRMEVTFDMPRDKPYVGEMILMRMRSFIRADVVLDTIEQPPLLDFSWQQLGRDRQIEAMIDGFDVTGIERDIAIFPDMPGRLIIEPFVRRVTVMNGDGSRTEASFSSKPTYVDVQSYAAINPSGAWWLPAKSLSLTDSWSQLPDEIKPGSLARRTITVEALGLTGDRLPPPPPMLAPGTIAFRGPVNRETIVTDDGPVARGTYVWDLRPVSASPAKLPAINVGWFDTRTRRMRNSAIPATWIALVGTLVHPSHEIRHVAGLLSPGPLAAGAAGFAWTAALLALLVLPRRRSSGRETRASRRALRTLRRCAHRRDPRGVAAALDTLARTDPARWRQVAVASSVAPQLAAFERSRFGRDAAPAPALRPFAGAVGRAWRTAEAPAAASPLLPQPLPPSLPLLRRQRPNSVEPRVLKRSP